MFVRDTRYCKRELICLTIISAAKAILTPMTLANVYFFAVAISFISPADNIYIKPEMTNASIATIPTVDNTNVNIFIKTEAKLGASEITPAIVTRGTATTETNVHHIPLFVP